MSYKWVHILELVEGTVTMKIQIGETKSTSLEIDIRGNNLYAWATGRDGKIYSGGVRKDKDDADFYYRPDYDKLYFSNPKQLQETIDILTELQRVLSRYEW